MTSLVYIVGIHTVQFQRTGARYSYIYIYMILQRAVELADDIESFFFDVYFIPSGEMTLPVTHLVLFVLPFCYL